MFEIFQSVMGFIQNNIEEGILDEIEDKTDPLSIEIKDTIKEYTKTIELICNEDHLLTLSRSQRKDLSNSLWLIADAIFEYNLQNGYYDENEDDEEDSNNELTETTELSENNN